MTVNNSTNPISFALQQIAKNNPHISPIESLNNYLRFTLFTLSFSEMQEYGKSAHVHEYEMQATVHTFKDNQWRPITFIFSRIFLFHPYTDSIGRFELHGKIKAEMKKIPPHEIEYMSPIELEEYRILKSIGSQRPNTRKVGGEMLALIFKMAEQKKHPPLLITKECCDFLGTVLATFNCARVEDITLITKYTIKGAPENILTLKKCFSCEYVCESCEAWHTTAYKLIACEICINAFYCNDACRNKDTGHKDNCTPSPFLENGEDSQ